MATEFKPLKVEDFGLSPEEMTALVVGAQKFFPPEPDEVEPSTTDKSD